MKKNILRFLRDVFMNNKVLWLVDKKGQVIDGYSCEGEDILEELVIAHNYFELSENEYLVIS